MSRQVLLVVSFALLLCPIESFAQEKPDTVESLSGIEITTSVDKADIYIGDLITYSLTIVYDSTIELIPPPLGANLGAFDVKDYQSDIITELPGGRIQSENMFKLSTFTTGDYVIPPVPVMFVLKDKRRKIVLSEAVPIKVNSLLLNSDDSVDIRPLKAQYEFKRDYTKYYWYGGAGLLVLIAGISLLWIRARRRRDVGDPVDLRPAWEIAFEKLAFLKEKRLLQEEAFKPYYIELTEICREYLGRMYSINVLDMTTEELLAQLEQLTTPDRFMGIMVELLHHADLVKFAKLIPDGDRAESDLDVVHDIIESVRAEHERRSVANQQLAEGERIRPHDLSGVGK
ncbi:MAG: hypothetical protein ACE5FH_06615 [Candidatus Zixiibacteriota bacterium]